MLRRGSQHLRASPTRLLRRGFSSRYEGDVADVLRFDCAFPSSVKLTPRDFRSRVVLVVNTASQCASAQAQMSALQQLHATYHTRGLDVIAVPSNDFDKKEPGGDEEIAMVYTAPEGPFKAQFYVAKKSAATGDAAHEFFDRVAKKYGRSVAPTWNFDKFLVDAYGDLSAVFPHDTDPLVPEVIEAIEDALAEIASRSENRTGDASDSDDSDSDEEDSDEEEVNSPKRN